MIFLKKKNSFFMIDFSKKFPSKGQLRALWLLTICSEVEEWTAFARGDEFWEGGDVASEEAWHQSLGTDWLEVGLCADPAGLSDVEEEIWGVVLEFADH